MDEERILDKLSKIEGLLIGISIEIPIVLFMMFYILKCEIHKLKSRLQLLL